MSVNPMASRNRTGRRTGRSLSGAALAAGTALALAACQSPSPGSGVSSGGSAGDADGAEVTVYAAASLGGASKDLAAAFAASHPGAKVTWNLAGSSALVRMMDEGGQPDLFISADAATMDRALEHGSVPRDAPRQVIASNVLQLVTAPGNPAGIRSVGQIGSADVALCAETVPCGRLARQALATAGTAPARATEESDVSAVASKVRQGQVDAGFVYATDARALVRSAANPVTVISLPGVESNAYPAALTDAGRRHQRAQQFYTWLGGPQARKILKEHGFVEPR